MNFGKDKAHLDGGGIAAGIFRGDRMRGEQDGLWEAKGQWQLSLLRGDRMRKDEQDEQDGPGGREGD
jgi:hypothetical protein